MDFGGFIGAMTAISMINDYDDVNTKRVEEYRMTDEVKEVVYNPAGDHGKHNHTLGSFEILSDKWGVE